MKKIKICLTLLIASYCLNVTCIAEGIYIDSCNELRDRLCDVDCQGLSYNYDNSKVTIIGPSILHKGSTYNFAHVMPDILCLQYGLGAAVNIKLSEDTTERILYYAASVRNNGDVSLNYTKHHITSNTCYIEP